MTFLEINFVIQILLNFTPEGPFDDKPAFVQAMAWCQAGDKPLPEAMMSQLLDTYVY